MQLVRSNKNLRRILIALFFLATDKLCAQELYVYSEPASIMPARSIMLKQSFQQMEGSAIGQVLNTQLELSIQKKWMAHFGTNFKSADFYTQYRFYSKDAIHVHTRLSWYAKAVSAGANPSEKAILLDGQQKVMGAGIITTRLQHRWASSLSLGWLYRYTGNTDFNKNAFQYSWSNGLLLYPVKYKNYQQTNINFYLELLGQQSIQHSGQFLDIAPAAQFIFNSQAKLNFGYRMPLWDSMQRKSNHSYYMSFDYLFFNALPSFKRRKK